MANATSYEVYIRQKGKWVLDSRYGENDKQTAIDDAKDREHQPGVEAVRVVREIHNATAGTSRDTTVYITPGLDPGKKPTDGGYRLPGGGGDDDDDGLPSFRSGPASYGSDDDDDGDGDAEQGIAAKMRAAIRRKAATAGAKAPGAGGFRASMVIMKILIIFGVSIAFASVTTFAYVRFL